MLGTLEDALARLCVGAFRVAAILGIGAMGCAAIGILLGLIWFVIDMLNGPSNMPGRR